MNHLRNIFPVLCAALLLCGCQHPEALVAEKHPEPWTPSEVENLLGGNDPWEGFNRSMFSCTDFTMNYVADPLGRFYTTIFPRPFIEHLQNVCTNLEFPAHATSCLLQAEWGGAGDDSLRFLINTTIGVAGIFDAAEHFWHIPPSRADFGQAFAKWGIGSGNTLMLPFCQTTNGRDHLGLLFDTAFDLKTYIPYAGWATALNRITLAQESYYQLTDGALDSYKNYRQSCLLFRELSKRLWFYREAQRQIARYKERLKAGIPDEPQPVSPALPRPADLHGNWIALPDYYSQGALVDSIRAVVVRPEKSNDYWYMRLSLFNSDFISQASMRKVHIEEKREKLVYAFWKAPKPDKPLKEEKLLLLLPGIGSQCTTNIAAAIAEKFHKHGYHVAAFDSIFNWRSTRTDDPAKLPGYLPDDALRVRRQLEAALKDLKDSGKIEGKVPLKIVLAGYSLGGMHTLKIAEMEEKDPKLHVSRYLAINPPVSSFFALGKIDDLIASTAGWTKTEMLNTLTRVTGPLFLTLTQKYPSYNPKSPKLSPMRYQMPVTVDDAAFIVGLNLKLSMRDLLFAAHREKTLPGVPAYSWWKRNDAYLAIDRITMRDYASKLLAPRYPKSTLSELYADCSLYPLEMTLKNNPKIYVLHNYDDILITPAERQWLDQTLDKRITWLSNGGHLGSLYFDNVTDELLASSDL